VNYTHRNEVKALFSAALDMPREDRAAFLTLEAGDQPELIAEVQSLLDAHDQPGEFLDTITHQFRSQAFAASSAMRSRMGERIGAYRIVGVLGTGGMGDVFRAVRDDDQYEAEVAIKLMRADVRSSVIEQRFRKERQILAALDHRNIARLMDGGTAEGGAPYVVMELVSGEPIDAFCEAQKLGVRERVQLFLQVCAAVSYAHQHLVVHRDLKPSNILVTADGSVKLLDFGIAKLLEANAPTDVAVAEANATATTLRAMTLEYASPEQVSGATVTTVSDVYSLGVVLYRLLTGKSPYRERTNDAARMAEILSDSTPTRPSEVERKLDSDLDNILLMALRKEPARRYSSVEQFGNDLRSYLAGMPVRARGNSLSYRAGKFVRRRKVEIAAAVLVTVALLGALVFSMREARIAERERQIAQQHYDSVRKLANTMLSQLHDEMAKDSGSIKSREMLVKTSLEYLNALYQQGSADKQLQEELALAYFKVAGIQGGDSSGANRGDNQGALQSYARGIALLTPLVEADPGNHRAGWELAEAYVERAALLMVTQGPKHAREAVDRGVALTETHAPAIADEAQRMARLRQAYTTQTHILGFMGLSLEAMGSADKAINVTEAYWREHPDDDRALLALHSAYNTGALFDDPRLSEADNYDKQLALHRRSQWAIEKLLASSPDNAEYQQRLATVRHNTANVLYARGQFAAAVELYRQAASVAVRLAKDMGDSNAQFTRGLFETHLALALFKSGKLEEARSLHLSCAKLLDEVLKRDGSLRTEYASGINAVGLGEIYAHLAENSRAGRETQLGLWRQANDSLRRGMTSLHRVRASAKLPSYDLPPIRDGEAALARVDAALARLGES
jgi:tRNA A-37 threonylcarbamoyl transferase component Bud32/tetratricopeptide (TPR) repeat protein